MDITDNRDIRHVFQHHGITNRELMRRIFVMYETTTDASNRVSLDAFLDNNLISGQLMAELRDIPETQKLLKHANIRDKGKQLEELFRFIHRNMDVYQEFLLNGLTEETYVLFRDKLEKWL